MDRNVLISIQGRQLLSESDGLDQIELITPGHFSREGGDYMITYRESELTGMEGTTTTLRVEGPRVVLSRMGDVCSHMIFEQGQRHLSYYETGEVPMTVGVSASRVSASLTDDGGKIEVDYELEIDQAFTGLNRITVNVSSLKS
ncbi:MAG: DUF1934 domain-containing protein [Oscillospiraceae bacterium]|nr:DUF1934 domain-containing protein [Oscillospiraceae bacterium]